MFIFGALLLAIPGITLLYKNNAQPTSTAAGGSVKILFTESNKISEISMQEYMVGAVFAQMPADFDDEALKAQYPEIDMVTTPDGAPVAMVHCNNGTSDLNAWVSLFGDFAKAAGFEISTGDLYGTLYRKALEGDADCGGLLTYGFLSGEHNVGMEEGRPLVVRTPETKFTLANFMRSNLLTSFGVLGIGNEILKKEQVKIDRITGHGGLFKTPVVGQKLLAACMNAPVYVMETAGEGGAWGIALLAAFSADKKDGQTLANFLENDIFGGDIGKCIEPDPADVEGFEAFMARYKAGLPIERAAIDSIR